MTALETIIVVLGVLTVAYMAAGVLGLLGSGPRERMSQNRMHHGDDVDAGERPSQDAIDPPLPHRRLRGRPANGLRGKATSARPSP